MTKADTLLRLKEKLKKSYIEDICVFTVGELCTNGVGILFDIKKRFGFGNVIVRSSAMDEDTDDKSQAGVFYSRLNVDVADRRNLMSAIIEVASSYKKAKMINWTNQIIIQRQTQNILVSGVVFTRQLGTNAPYYIINYDDISRKTDTVTGGKRSFLTCISRFATLSKNNEWYPLIESVKEIENYYSNKVLDIEFAITEEDKISIFQVRPLAANKNIKIPDDKHIKELVENMKIKYRSLSKKAPHILGRHTIFGDMPDWNPAEIIGNKPNTLDYSIYSYLFTNSIWHEARTSMGYRNVFPAELMVSFGKRPFIDTRLSFNSFLPTNVKFKLGEKLINNYINDLCLHPEKQDKVEFEILLTCYDLSFGKKAKRLRRKGFTESELRTFKKILHSLTKQIIKSSETSFAEDLQLLLDLARRKNKLLSSCEFKTPWDILSLAYDLLENCKNLGALPFARLARTAFIGKSLLMSMKEEGAISKHFYDIFLNSIETITSQFGRDLILFQKGKMEKKAFFEQYGHLRPGTYDITAPRYDSLKKMFKFCKAMRKVKIRDKKNILRNKLTIDFAIKEHNLQTNAKKLLDFIATSIRLREYAKFEFTKVLSDVLELIAKAGNMLGIDREDLSYVDLGALFHLRNYEYLDYKFATLALKRNILRHKKEHEWAKYLVLPPLICSEKDFDVIDYYEAHPNFITTKTATGNALHLDKGIFPKLKTFDKYVILLDNADPGFDWIFTRKPLAIVTKYGGANSHMAIRCAEFGVPAAIGCGTIIYEKLLKATVISMDCSREILRLVV